MYPSRHAWLAGVAVAALATAAPATAQRFDYSGSVQYATGEYFLTERSNSVFLLNGLGMSLGRLRVSGSVPFILQSSPWITYTTFGSGTTGMGGSVDGTSTELRADTATQQQVGLGDPMFYAGLEVVRSRAGMLSVRVSGSVKAPLGDVERGFSTGQWDYAAGLALSGVLGGTLLFADVAYWVFGDPPGLEYIDPIAYSFGVGRPFANGKLGLMASVFGYTEVIEGATPPVQASLGLSYLVDFRRSLMGTVSFGLTDSSPDIAVSVGWSLALGS